MGKAPLIISVSGLRGLVGTSLDEGVVSRYVGAFVRYLRESEVWGQFPPRIVTGYDGRSSGEALLEVVHQTLWAGGLEPCPLGVAATPTVGFLTAHGQFLGGIQLTASHNPHPWNGLKLFHASGRVLPGVEGEKVRHFYESGENGGVFNGESGEKGWEVRGIDFQKSHIEAILALVDVEAIRKKRYSVLLDANHGSGSVLGKVLLEALGCEVFFAQAGEKPDGKFVHTPEPIAENLSETAGEVAKKGCVVGFCQDPDADRLAVVDERGNYIGEEYTIVLCAEAILRRGGRGALVTNGASSLMTRDLARKYGVPYFYTPVGEANVVDRMMAEQALFGGEGNGGPIEPRIGWVRDSFVGMALILDFLASEEVPISRLVERYEKYVLRKEKLSFDTRNLPTWYARLQEHFSDAVVDTGDGLRLAWEDRWLLVRPSNTEPIVRLMAEAKTVEGVEELFEIARNLA
ncbi:MAG: phosphoglucosamine mutase [Planctomycetia bacterium]|nr:phosphoglucosamine mutase [Planctomycetia bacterium]